jgi:hypothetical protein
MPESPTAPTQGAVALVEAERPTALRSFCLATSAVDFPPSRPSSWSAALDQVAAGSMPGDGGDGVAASGVPKRLVLVATGNVSGGMMGSPRSPSRIRRRAGTRSLSAALRARNNRPRRRPR